jgi:hypothetical protein
MINEMKHFTLEEKFNIIKQVSDGSMVGIHNFGLLHDIADALGMKNNSGMYLYSISNRITKIMRDLMKAGYPVKEYRIKCCSWSEKETWHPCFGIEGEVKE